MLSVCEAILIRFFLSEVDAILILRITTLAVVSTLSVDVAIAEVLPTEGAHHFVLLKLASVPVHKLGPLIHLMSRLLIKLFLVEVILLLELLRELPDDIVLELKQLALLFVVLEEHLALS